MALRVKSFCIFLVAVINILNGQQAQLIKDIHAGEESSVTFFDREKIVLPDFMLFSAKDAEHGSELWRTDGTEEGTYMVKDINEGTADSECQNYYLVGEVILFTAEDSNGVELWITDGTQEGTQLLKDINPGPADGFGNFLSQSKYFIVWEDVLYFAAETEDTDFELWRSDGTEDGTFLLKNIVNDFGSFAAGSFPQDFAIFQDELYFSSREGLWKSDGTAAGTKPVKSEDPALVFGLEPDDLLALDDRLIFWESNGLWASDGTNAGTKLIKELSVGTLNSFGNRFQRIGNKALFPADDGVTGSELWVTDGTAEGTNLVIDAQPGSAGYPPQNFVAVDTIAFFKYEDSDHGIELWRSDGTSSGTYMVLDINPGAQGSFTLPSVLYSDGQTIYFRGGSNSFRQGLWTSDGTAAGTFQLAEQSLYRDASPGGFATFNDQLIFYADTDTLGWEYYILKAAGTTASHDAGSSTAQFLIYPNPLLAGNQVTISNLSDEPIQSCQIISNAGKVLVDQKINLKAQQQATVSLPHLWPGIYFVGLDKRSTSFQKIIIF